MVHFQHVFDEDHVSYDEHQLSKSIYSSSKINVKDRNHIYSQMIKDDFEFSSVLNHKNDLGVFLTSLLPVISGGFIMTIPKQKF